MKVILYFLSLVTVARASAKNAGIGTTTTTSPLSFNNILGNKIALWGDGITSPFSRIYSNVLNIMFLGD